MLPFLGDWETQPDCKEVDAQWKSVVSAQYIGAGYRNMISCSTTAMVDSSSNVHSDQMGVSIIWRMSESIVMGTLMMLAKMSKMLKKIRVRMKR